MFKHMQKMAGGVFVITRSEYTRHGGAAMIVASAYHYDSLWGAVGALGTFFALRP